jgi:5-methylthioribose kinase
VTAVVARGPAGHIGLMWLIDQSNAADYLRDTGRVAPDEPLRVSELAGGVSNLVLLVERQPPGEALVIKQARAQLRTQQVWFSSIERIWREADVLAACGELLARAAAGQSVDATLRVDVPRTVFEDRDHYLFAMTAAPRPHVVWKAELLAGRGDERVAAACGRLLAALHGGSWGDERLAKQFADRTLFDELRVDPYYRTLAAARPEACEAVGRLVESLACPGRSLVHGDFSPKNLLVAGESLTLVDFETGHWGDPAFDLGFFLSHLVLKAAYRLPRHEPLLELTETFRRAYDAAMIDRIGRAELAELWRRGAQNFAGCAWARLDGKSPVDYLSDEERRQRVRSLCRAVFARQPDDWSQVVALASSAFAY